MPGTRRSALHLAVMLVLVAAGFALWMAHARAWDLGRRSPVLGFDAAQYALAARTLAEEGRLASTFALPIELVRHPTPPWPLAVVQPGLVITEAAVERLVPHVIGSRRAPTFSFQLPHQREWLSLVVPFVCYLLLGALLALLAARLIERHTPGVAALERAIAALAVGGAFLLDPEAQHFAVGGFTELPYTVGIVAALAALATGRAGRAPLVFGLLLGVTGTFRGNLLWLAPWLAAGAAALAPEGRRRRAFALVLLGYAVPLMPWWIYKWRHFGSPAWDLSALALWDGVGGRTWFSLTHLPSMPGLPHGWEAARLLAGKLVRNVGPLLLAMTVGPRGLWIGAIVVWLLAAGGARPLRIAAILVLAHAGIAVIVAALGAGWLRYLFPARVPLEAAGVLASWALLGRVPPGVLGPGAVRAARFAVVALALGWGAWQTARGNAEAAATVASRGMPSVLTLRDLGHRLRRELAPGEAVMSNLGPTLAWYARRPVVHLALTPADVDACRARLPFRHVVLAFRDVDHAWRGWDELVRNPEAARAHPDWSVLNVRAWQTRDDGFTVVWIELAPSHPAFALRGER